jgi:flagellar biosynthesis/type III secretory pathway protein FliH
MGALMEDKEVLAMLERMIQVMEDELQLDTPFMQRLREAREEGREEGLSLGREEGLSLGTLATLRRDILDAMMVRFSPTEQECAQVETHLATMTDETRLRALFRAALRAENMELFLQDLVQNRNGRQNGSDTTEQSQ